jgi:hypothetical protein
MSKSKNMVVLLRLGLYWTTYTSSNSDVLDQLLYWLNSKPTTYNQTCFNTKFANTKHLTVKKKSKKPSHFAWNFYYLQPIMLHCNYCDNMFFEKLNSRKHFGSFHYKEYSQHRCLKKIKNNPSKSTL